MAAPPPKPSSADPAQPQDASGRLRSAGDELAEACAALEAEVEELKVKYEMYFLGVELREPAKLRQETKKKVVRLKEQFTRNTGLRFRLQSLHARFISYERLWLRSAREREEGTYRRDLFKAKLHGRGKAPLPRGAAGGAAARRPSAPAPHDGEDVDLSDFHDEVPLLTPSPMPLVTASTARPAAAVPAPPAAPAPAARPAEVAPRPPPAPAPAGRIADAQLRELYEAYVSAKRRCNEDVSRLTFDAVASSVSKQIPEIMRQHKARSVEFRVVIKDGKAKLTAVPRG